MMQNFWEERYAEERYAYGTEPNAFLVKNRDIFEQGRSALAVADGEGRNGAWLAKQGLRVTSVDGSLNGLKKAQKLAQSYGRELTTIQADLTQWDWPVGQFDYVISVFVQFPDMIRAVMHKKMMEALKPGGRIVMQSFHKEQIKYNSGGPKNLSMLYLESELSDDFKEMDIRLLESQRVELDEGPFHQGTASVINFIARKAD